MASIVKEIDNNYKLFNYRTIVMYSTIVLNSHDAPQPRIRREHIAADKLNITNPWFVKNFINTVHHSSTAIPQILSEKCQLDQQQYKLSSTVNSNVQQHDVHNHTLPIKADDDGWYNTQLSIVQPYTPITSTTKAVPAIAYDKYSENGNKQQRINIQSSSFYYGCVCGHNFIYRPYDDLSDNSVGSNFIAKSPVVNIQLRY